eukprot:760267-Hanusia_phi.AAC.7
MRWKEGLCSWCSTKETWTHVQLECKEFSRAIQAAHNIVARVLQEELIKTWEKTGQAVQHAWDQPVTAVDWILGYTSRCWPPKSQMASATC